jgi:hypothetical protein
VHEAGHVVAAILLGVDVEGASKGWMPGIHPFIESSADDDARAYLGPPSHDVAFYLSNPAALRQEMEKRVQVLMA